MCADRYRGCAKSCVRLFSFLSAVPRLCAGIFTGERDQMERSFF